MKLILNADDFGLTQGVNDAIVELAAFGSISSTTVMVNMPYWEQVTDLMQFPDFGIGLHLNLTEGRPLSEPAEIPSLIGENGNFFGQAGFRQRERRGLIFIEDMRTEIEAQYNRLKNKIGARLDHLDSHQNIHKAPSVAKTLLQFGLKNPGLGLRAPYRYVLHQNKLIPGFWHSIKTRKLKRAVTDLYLWNLTRKYRRVFSIPKAELHAYSFRKLDLLKEIAEIPAEENGCFEIACHPAKDTQGLGPSNLTVQRINEYQFMNIKIFRLRFQTLTLTSFRLIQ